MGGDSSVVCVCVWRTTLVWTSSLMIEVENFKNNVDVAPAAGGGGEFIKRWYRGLMAGTLALVLGLGFVSLGGTTLRTLE